VVGGTRLVPRGAEACGAADAEGRSCGGAQAPSPAQQGAGEARTDSEAAKAERDREGESEDEPLSGYVYAMEREHLFTDEGQRMFL
jgi:hypothetical protein